MSALDGDFEKVVDFGSDLRGDVAALHHGRAGGGGANSTMFAIGDGAPLRPQRQSLSA